ncbi:MAG: DNA polymerase III subunit delta, partial [Acidobacteria bacterium]|nr:DNA polymerase III subunit delta [Acidobacteriota bacterium]
VRKQIAARDTAPLYLLEGDDLQSRHDLALEFAAMVDEDLHAFNVEHFYANEATTASARDQLIGALLSAARTLPMMVPRRVVVLHEAERLLSPRKAKDEEPEAPPPAVGRGKKSGTPTPVEELEAYFGSPEPLTTMIVLAGPLDANRRLVRAVRKHAIVVNCGTLDTPADAARWIRDRLAKDRMAIEPSAIALLLEGTGLALGRVRAEIDKLVLYAAGESTVTARHVRDLVLPQNEPGTDFALGRAIWNGNAAQALREIAAQLDEGGQPPLILGQIRAAAGRLRPDSKIKSGLEAVFLTDLAIKSSAGDPRFLLERLVVELCAAGGPSRSSWQRR